LALPLAHIVGFLLAFEQKQKLSGFGAGGGVSTSVGGDVSMPC